MIAAAAWISGCSCEDESEAEQRDPVTGLTAAEANEVLVKVGDRSITLGDYVATLLRMDEFERLRYQTEESQKKLLDEMIQVELLAQEARRRGIDDQPDVVLEIQQALRDELLHQLEMSLPPLEEISEREVREYYEAHRSEFKEPERRRVLMIRVGTAERAETLLAEAKGASGQKWGELAAEYSLDRHNLGEDGARELAGDVGFVSAPGQERGANDAVPDPVRKAIFELEKVGDVLPRALQEGSFHYVIRLGGISPARDRSVTEADRPIRVELRRRKFVEAEKKLEADLREKYPVTIDAQAIQNHQAKVRPDDTPDKASRP